MRILDGSTMHGMPGSRRWSRGVESSRPPGRSRRHRAGLRFLCTLLATAGVSVAIGVHAQYPVSERTTVEVTETRSTTPKRRQLVVVRKVEKTVEKTQAVVVKTAVLAAPVAAVVAIGSATASAISAVAAVVSAAPAAAAVPTATTGGLPGMLQTLLPLLGFRRRRSPLGRVVEEGTNVPVPGAVVTILDAFGKPRETAKTHADGTFGVLLPSGVYRLDAQWPGYAFTATPRGVALFPDERLYTGTPVTVEREKLVPIVVVLRRTVGRTRVSVGVQFRILIERVRILHSYLAIPILFVGAMLNTIAFLRTPSVLLGVLEGTYLLLFVLEFFLSRAVKHAVGRVRDATRRSPVALAIVRLIEKHSKQLMGTRVTSPRGQFFLLPSPGDYSLQVIHNAYEPYRNDAVVVPRGGGRALRLDVFLTPRRGGASPSAGTPAAP